MLEFSFLFWLNKYSTVVHIMFFLSVHSSMNTWTESIVHDAGMNISVQYMFNALGYIPSENAGLYSNSMFTFLVTSYSFPQGL